ncbi:hypothetical protein [Nonomuraea sp. NPDC049504]|uniref:hypothetical protein n=1 Tax=Nonomuraea sp. NPDC049504 TaxID=3154729 RepID=UPI00341B3A01
MFAAAVAVALGCCGVAAPAHATTGMAEVAGVTFRAYSGASPSAHQAHFESLRSRGYRPITVSVSAGPKYAAVWVKSGGPAWISRSGLSEASFKARFDEYLAQGYQPISVSATGPAGRATFAALWEKRSERFFSRMGLTGAQFAAQNRKAHADGYVPVSIDMYGTPSDPRYVAVWRKSEGGGWYYSYGKSFAGHKSFFTKRTAEGYRPTAVAVGPGGTRFAAVYRKDGVRPWHHYIDTSASAYQRRFDSLVARGLRPVQVNIEDGVYASVWTR